MIFWCSGNNSNAKNNARPRSQASATTCSQQPSSGASGKVHLPPGQGHRKTWWSSYLCLGSLQAPRRRIELELWEIGSFSRRTVSGRVLPRQRSVQGRRGGACCQVQASQFHSHLWWFQEEAISAENWMAKKKKLVKLCKNCDQKLDWVDAANKQIHGCSFHQIGINSSCLKHFFSK